jgi:membrane associated rhomboid family serine protease
MATDVQTCYRHADRRAGVRCQRCDRPICPACMNQASVGFHCPECARRGRQKVMTASSLATKPYVTWALVAINLVVYLFDAAHLGRNVSQLGDLGDQGALFGPLIAQGDWWRPITAGFLHVSLVHVGFNMFLLYQLGALLEPAVKHWAFAALYFMSLVGGSFLVLIIDPNQPTVGASGAVFGLMGATFVAMRSRGIDPFSNGIGYLIVINLVLTFAIPNISIGGHIGGLITGAIGGWILWVWGPKLGRNSPIPAIVCAVIGGLLYAGCLLVV